MAVFRSILQCARRLAARFVNLDAITSYNTIIYKVANIIAAEKVEGDYLEFGVYQGDSMIQAYHTLKGVFHRHQQLNGGRTEQDAQEIQRIWNELRFFAFDSFQGLPNLEGVDKCGRDFAPGKYACPQDQFFQQLKTNRVDTSKVIAVPGWFSETCTPATLATYGLKKAAIVHIDCDLYASTKTALEFITPLLVDGTVIIFDDWYCFRGNPALGEQRAFREWSRELTGWVFTEYQKEGPWSNSFIASRVENS